MNQDLELGFSIKSELGNYATILNAGETTNFVYQIDEFAPSIDEINEINTIDTKSKIKDRVAAIIQKGGKFRYMEPQNNIFKNNLILIDSLLPEILSEIVLAFYNSNLSTIKDLTALINKTNPINFDKQFAHDFYEYKMKRLLTDVTLGMMPSKVWTGIYDATGGYLIVKGNRDVLSHHNLFEDYLFANTKLETPSSNRHKFGKIYQQDGQFFFKLNLQIRFK